MKVAIVSQLDLYNTNYGNRLQAYALNSYLNNNYKNLNVESLVFENNYKKKRTKIGIKTIKNFINKFKRSKTNNFFYDFSNRLERFNEFSKKYTKLCSKELNWKSLKKTDYDIFVVGSDVVWAQYDEFVNKIRYLDFKNNTDFKKIAYSASFGRDYIPKENKKYLNKKLKKFDFISVREKSSIKLLKTIGINNVYHTCDPTLLIDKKHWSSISKKVNIRDKYIFVYLLGKDKKQREEITKIARNLNLKIVTIPHANGLYNEVDDEFGDYRLDDCSPEEWIYLIENCEYVITDSFHGIVFSTIFEKKFIALKREYTEDINNRLMDYLDTIDEKDKYMVVPNFVKLKKIKWDYKKINIKLAEFIDKSQKYLNEIFNK